MQEFYKIVQSATKEQRKNLAELTESAFGDAPDILCNHVRYLRAGSILFTLNQPNWNRLTLAVVYVSMLRNSA